MTIHRPHAFYRLSPQVREELETITLTDSKGRPVKTHRLSARVRRQIADARRNPAYLRLFGPDKLLIDRGFPTAFIEACQPQHHAWTLTRGGIEVCVICHRVNPASLAKPEAVAQPIQQALPALF